ncbi:hypothetical protein G6F46_013581 [Rhizopus delemar]|nr:hypothetical protein G6F46_013581 [Rhizopus delemar]
MSSPTACASSSPGCCRMVRGVTTSTVTATHTASIRRCPAARLRPPPVAVRAAPRQRAIPASPVPCLPAGLALSGSRPAASRGRSGCPARRSAPCHAPARPARLADVGLLRFAARRCGARSTAAPAGRTGSRPWAARRPRLRRRSRLRLPRCRNPAASVPACAARWLRLRATARDESQLRRRGRG